MPNATLRAENTNSKLTLADGDSAAFTASKSPDILINQLARDRLIYMVTPPELTTGQFEQLVKEGIFSSPNPEVRKVQLLIEFAEKTPDDALRLLPDEIFLDMLPIELIAFFQKLPNPRYSELLFRFRTNATFLRLDPLLQMLLISRISNTSPSFIPDELILSLIPNPLDISCTFARKALENELFFDFLYRFARLENEQIQERVLEFTERLQVGPEFFHSYRAESLGKILRLIVEYADFYELDSFFPQEINLNTLPEDLTWFLARLLREYPQSFVRNHTFTNTEALLYSEKLGYLAKEIGKVRADYAHALIPAPPIDFSQVTNRSYLMLFPTFRLENHDTNYLRTLLPDIIDLNTISFGGAQLLYKLMQKCNRFDLLITALPDEISIDQLRIESARLLELCIPHSEELQNHLETSLSGRLRLSESHPSARGEFTYSRLLMALLKANREQPVLRVLSATIPALEGGNYDFWHVVTRMLQSKPREIREQTAQLITDDTLYLAFMTEGSELISVLHQSGLAEQSQLLASIRDPSLFRPKLRVNEYTLPADTKGNLVDQIDAFPLENTTTTKLNSGWYRSAPIAKPFDETRVHAYFHPGSEDHPFSLILRSKSVPSKGVEAYREAYQKMPLLIGLANYPELTDDRLPVACFRGTGFREVYQGPSVGQFVLEELPKEIRDSILSQMEQIKALFDVHNIKHGHLHTGNFNVRFLLSSEDDTKNQLSFDIAEAIQAAKTHAYFLTPIVTVRDWDLATTEK